MSACCNAPMFASNCFDTRLMRPPLLWFAAAQVAAECVGANRAAAKPMVCAVPRPLATYGRRSEAQEGEDVPFPFCISICLVFAHSNEREFQLGSPVWAGAFVQRPTSCRASGGRRGCGHSPPCLRVRGQRPVLMCVCPYVTHAAWRLGRPRRHSLERLRRHLRRGRRGVSALRQWASRRAPASQFRRRVM